MLATLSHERVVNAGLQLTAQRGLSAVTLRSVAASLHVTPMALYRHVGDAESLFSNVVAVIVDAIPAVPVAGGPQDRLREWARATRQTLAAYPGAAAHLMTNWFTLPAVLDTLEDLLAAAEDSGLRGFDAVALVNSIFMFVLMRVEAEQAIRSAGVVRRTLAFEGSARPLRRLRANARFYEVAELDAHFDYGLDLILHGVRRRRRAVLIGATG